MTPTHMSQPTAKQNLATVIESARTLGLVIRWCNDGDLVMIGIPNTQAAARQEPEKAAETPDPLPPL